MKYAKATEEKYSCEIVDHAKSIKVVNTFKNELSEVNSTKSEASWNQQQEIFNKEIADLTAW
ncbi:hypothetical protein ACEPAH_3091 [Sanghuangporus vaninii]